jgi:hypothetical protein
MALQVLPHAGKDPCPGPTWQRDWKGQWVDLTGLRPGGDALPGW